MQTDYCLAEYEWLIQYSVLVLFDHCKPISDNGACVQCLLALTIFNLWSWTARRNAV